MRRTCTVYVVAALCAIPLAAAVARGQGFLLPAAGSIHQSMGGASTAAPIDANGAGLWNPAALSGLPESEFALDSAFLIPRFYVGSTSPRGGAGSTRSDSGVASIPAAALVYRFADMPRLTVGMASAITGGGSVNFPGDPTNPVFAPKFPAAPAPGGITLGPSYSNFSNLQVMNNFAFQVTDRLAVGAGPVVNMIMASFDPAFFAAPDDANGDGVMTFPSATHTRPFWGIGFKAGIFYRLNERFDVGFGYGSPQWIENMVFHSRDEIGNPRTLVLPVRLPAYYSWGVAFKGIEKLLLALDFRFIDYKNSTPFGPAPAAGGLAWNNVFAVATGVQYEFSERFSARVGYSYNTPPIPTNATLFNVQGPSILQHVISTGFTVRVAENMSTSLAYSYGAFASITGSPLQLPGGTSTLSAQIHNIMLTTTVKFGSPRRRPEAGTSSITDTSTATAPAVGLSNTDAGSTLPPTNRGKPTPQAGT